MLLYANEIEVDLGCLDAASPVPQAEHDLLELGATIDGLGLDKPVADDLGNRVREASKALPGGKLDTACKQLSDLAKKIGEQERKGKLTSAQAAQLTRRSPRSPGSSAARHDARASARRHGGRRHRLFAGLRRYRSRVGDARCCVAR